MATTNAVSSGDLVDLISTSASATVYPTDDAILSVLNSRFRSDLPYSRISTSHLVVVNPYKTLANLNDVSAKEYETRCYKETSSPVPHGPAPLPPHLYELAAQIYLLMRRRNESQSVILRSVSSPGSFLINLLTFVVEVSLDLEKVLVQTSSFPKSSVYQPTPSGRPRYQIRLRL